VHRLCVILTLIEMALSIVGSSRRVIIRSCGVPSAQGVYVARPASLIPEKFSEVCRKARWNSKAMWAELTTGDMAWFLKEETGGYIYYNAGDRQWWIDGEDGLGLYIAPGGDDLSSGLPPLTGWAELKEHYLPLPTLEIEKSSDAEL
jgi:hypothetical protein